MKKLLMGAMLATLVLPMSPVAAEPERSWSDQQRDEDTRANQRHENRDDKGGEGVNHRRQHHDNGRHLGWQKRPTWQQYNRYDYNRFEPRFGNYQANQSTRSGLLFS